MAPERQHTVIGDETASPETAGRLMRAIVQDGYGGAGVLRLARIPRPSRATARCCCTCTRRAWTGDSGI